jgi:hypothetical protein
MGRVRGDGAAGRRRRGAPDGGDPRPGPAADRGHPSPARRARPAHRRDQPRRVAGVQRRRARRGPDHPGRHAGRRAARRGGAAQRCHRHAVGPRAADLLRDLPADPPARGSARLRDRPAHPAPPVARPALPPRRAAGQRAARPRHRPPRRGPPARRRAGRRRRRPAGLRGRPDPGARSRPSSASLGGGATPAAPASGDGPASGGAFPVAQPINASAGDTGTGLAMALLGLAVLAALGWLHAGNPRRGRAPVPDIATP